MNLSSHWQLNPEIAFLNHGSFGATPTTVLDKQQRLQADLERDPIQFLAPECDLEPKLDFVRGVLARLVHASPQDLAFVRTATDGVNAVLRSMPLSPDDEIIVTDHGYNACNNAARYAAERCGAAVKVAKVPFPLTHGDQVIEAIEDAITSRTRILVVDHVTSPTGLIFPIEQIVAEVQARGIRVLVDGAHAPGMVPLDLDHLQPDYYTANHHKWLCAPKVSGFLYVRPELQEEVRPTVISHGANLRRAGRSKFITEFDWCGTFDPTPLLSLPAAIDFLDSLFPGGIDELMAINRQLALDARDRLCEALRIAPPAADAMIGSLVSVPLPNDGKHASGGAAEFQRILYHHHRIEAPIFPWPQPDGWMLRVSLQAYNDIGQIDHLCDVLRQSIATEI